MRRGLVSALLAVSALIASLAANVALAATVPVNQAQSVQRVVDLVNAERQKVGLSPLTSNGLLTQAAQSYAVVLADGSCFGHECGSTLDQRLDQVGYTGRSAWGENIASGFATPEAVMTAWMNSSGHRSNILSADFKEIGVGLVAKSGGSLVWVQDFGKSRTAAGTQPTPTPTPIAPAPPTPTPAPSAGCSPRPAFNVRTSASAPGVLQVTVAADSGGTNNTLRAVRIGSVVNGTVDVSGRGQVASGTTVSMAAGTQQATITVRRVASGAATTVPLFLTDNCGEWPTFVGGGPSAF
jgi:uncharacterized protein YkwD